jgi:hypothetical protein
MNRFIPTQNVVESCERRHVPRSLLLLLSKLICVDPNTRPTADKVKMALSTINVSGPATTTRFHFRMKLINADAERRTSQVH